MSEYDRARDRDTWERIFRDADPAWLLAPPSPLMQQVADFFQTAARAASSTPARASEDGRSFSRKSWVLVWLGSTMRSEAPEWLTA